MKILGIETSCDETAASIVEDGHKLLSNVVASSMAEHVQYGGVVPEVAARAQIESIMPVIDEALRQAFPNHKSEIQNSKQAPNTKFQISSTSNSWDQIDGIAVTYGAGLGGSLLVGVLTARTLAIIKQKPLYAINHVEAHLYANFLTETSLPGYKLPSKIPEFPILGLIVSGGHTQLVLFKDHHDYKLLGQTQDDAIGEAFDKVAKVLDLPYPGGPSITTAALKGDPHKFKIPAAKMPGQYDFSFSGPKTAVLRLVQQICGKSYDFPSFKLAELLNESQKADIAASFQFAAVKTVVDKTLAAAEEFAPKSVVIGGGVASSAVLRRQLAEKLPLPIEYTDPKLCTDNGAMVAALGCFQALHKQPTADPYSLDIQPNLSM
ncbi:MAG: tRNA (adenosine(37)-N6)-threonylcarbamoyltransferase complex transferase subunit TsaD [Candidatus Saccharimonadales bacterium]